MSQNEFGGANNPFTVKINANSAPVDDSNPLPVSLSATPSIDIGDVTLLGGNALVGNVGGVTPRSVASYTVAANSGAYTDGYLMGNSNTAGSVVPLSFDLTKLSGEITGGRCAVSAASGAPVTTNLAFDLLLFRPGTNIPFAAAGYPANNAIVTFADAATARAVLAQLVGQLSFAAGAATQGNSGWTGYGTGVQAVYQRGLFQGGLVKAPINIAEFGTGTIVPAIMRARAAWNNGNVAHHFIADANGKPYWHLLIALPQQDADISANA